MLQGFWVVYDVSEILLGESSKHKMNAEYIVFVYHMANFYLCTFI